jgi:hypothetical protein
MDGKAVGAVKTWQVVDLPYLPAPDRRSPISRRMLRYALLRLDRGQRPI